MRQTFFRSRAASLFASVALAATALTSPVALYAGTTPAAPKKSPERAAAPAGTVRFVMVIDMENENYATTFGPTSPATYLNGPLLQQGQLIPNYFGTSHVSLGNYISQVSGQGTNGTLNNDCINLSTLTAPPVTGTFNNIVPGTDSADPAQVGQVVGTGCVFPAPTATTRGAQTIGEQLDARYPHPAQGEGRFVRFNWREYAEDMGDDPARDYGVADATGGTDCAHAPIDGVDHSNSAAANDQYATRHNPFVYFHSVIDNQTRCNSHVVPLGKITVGTGGAPDTFSGHLFEDLKKIATTPKFMFVTTNLCNNGHDASCVGPTVEHTTVTTPTGTKNAGGLTAADEWLKHWMPMIFNSPAYQAGQMLIVLTFDESGFSDARACPNADQSTCGSPVGPNATNPGFSPILGMFHAQTTPTATYQYAGGGQVGAVLFHKTLIKPGTVNTTGVYNHFSALRSYEDMLGVRTGGDDNMGHLGFAGLPSSHPFGKDVFNNIP